MLKYKTINLFWGLCISTAVKTSEYLSFKVSVNFFKDTLYSFPNSPCVCIAIHTVLSVSFYLNGRYYIDGCLLCALVLIARLQILIQGVLKIRKRFLNLVPLPISFLTRGASFNRKKLLRLQGAFINYNILRQAVELILIIIQDVCLTLISPTLNSQYDGAFKKSWLRTFWVRAG